MAGMKFGVFAPQGWKMDLVEIDDPVEQFEAMTNVGRAADNSNLDSVWVYDHFHTVPTRDRNDLRVLDDHRDVRPRHQRVKIGQMVDCNGYRNPALYAKIASTVDVASHGRLFAGFGAGWYEHEWRAYGYGFPDTQERMARSGKRSRSSIRCGPRSAPFRAIYRSTADQRTQRRGGRGPVVDRRRRREGDAQTRGSIRRRLQRRRRQGRRDPPE